jgi:hypothetical protein
MGRARCPSHKSYFFLWDGHLARPNYFCKRSIEFTAGTQKPGFMGENTWLQPVDTAKNPVKKVDINSASIVGRKIESTVNTQLSFSFSTPLSTVNSQQSTIIPVQPELI